MKLILIAALMFMGCTTTPRIELVSELEQIEYIQSIVGEEVMSQLITMLEYNPLLTDEQVEMIVGRELMIALKNDERIQGWMNE